MAVRLWNDDSSELRVPTIASSNITGEVFTFAALVKPVAKADWEAFMSAYDLTRTRTTWTFGTNPADKPFYQVTQVSGSTQLTISTGTALTSGQWYIVVYTARPARQFSVYSFTAGTWEHSAGDLSGGIGAPTSNDYISFGRDVQYGFDLKAKMALAEITDSGLTDLQIEKFSENLATTDWVGHVIQPSGLWSFTQGSTGEDVPDVMGNHVAITGAITGDTDLNGRTGTAVITVEDPPGWDLTVPPPLLAFSLRLSGGATNDNPSLSIGGATSSALADDVFDSVGSAQALIGQVDYRLIYVANNESAVDGDITGYISLQQTSPSGHQIAIGAATEAAGVTVSPIANATTAPAGVTFSAPTSSGTAVALGTVPASSFKGVWLRRTIPAGADDAISNPAQVSIEVTPTA